MKLLFDMNLSPQLASMMSEEGWDSIHWSAIGNPKAPDDHIMDYAVNNGCWVVTNDLDFGDILAATNAQGPSVIQFRIQDLSPEHLKPLLLAILKQYNRYLEEGALISADAKRSRVRILPFK